MLSVLYGIPHFLFSCFLLFKNVFDKNNLNLKGNSEGRRMGWNSTRRMTLIVLIILSADAFSRNISLLLLVLSCSLHAALTFACQTQQKRRFQVFLAPLWRAPNNFAACSSSRGASFVKASLHSLQILHKIPRPLAILNPR